MFDIRRHAVRLLQVLACAGLATLAGCATYTPKPLHPEPAERQAGQLSVPAERMPTPALRAHRFDPSDGLDVTETAMLAVANNPDLKVMRDQLDVSRAQAFEAGLLPDPQLSASRDQTTSSGQGLTNGYTLGLSYDLGPLFTRSARVASARASQRQVRLELLWAEWQTIAQARLLFDQVQYLRVQQRRLERERSALGTIDATIDTALKQGNLDYAGASAGLDATANVRTQLGDSTRQLKQAEHALRQLLGLAPQAPLHLVGPPWQPRPTTAQIADAMKDLVKRRPDLLALKAGYAAQEANVRAAILGQFPDIQVGVNRARDNSNVYSTGISVGITLPLFNGNRGQVAVSRATRKELADDYRARLLATRNTMHLLVADLHTLDREIGAARTHARQLEQAGKAATASWKHGELDWPTWLSIRSSALTADMDLFALRQQRATASIALETLLGGDWSDTGAPDARPTKTAERSP